MKYSASLQVALVASLVLTSSDDTLKLTTDRGSPTRDIECRCCVTDLGTHTEHYFLEDECELGGDGCDLGQYCRQRFRASGGADTTFHVGLENAEEGVCNQHLNCTEPQEEQILQALDREQFDAVAEMMLLKPHVVGLNATRELLQIRDCSGRIVTQVRVDVGRLQAALLDARLGSAPQSSAAPVSRSTS